MARTAEAILRQKRTIQKQEAEIARLERELKEKSSSYTISKQQLKTLLAQGERLKKEADSLQQELAFAIAKSVSLSVLLNEKYSHDINSIIELEVLKAKLKYYKERIKKLNTAYLQTLSSIRQISSQAQTLKSSIDEIDRKRKKLIAIQQKNKKDLKRLKIA